VILRNPVEQAWSEYRYGRRGRNERRDLATFIKDTAALSGGLYHMHLQRYLALFRREALLVLIYEELVQDPGRELGRLTGFLNVPMIWSDPTVLLQERVNASEIPRFPRGFALARRAGGLLARHDLNWPVRLAKRLGVRRWFGRTAAEPSMAAAERRHLADFYRDDVRRLGLLLQRDLDLWQL
jgi:Sulfotransferase domain